MGCFASSWALSAILARSHSVRKRRMARELDRMRENLAEEKLMYEQEAAGMTTNTDLSQEAIADFVRERLELNQREERRAESAIRSR